MNMFLRTKSLKPGSTELLRSEAMAFSRPVQKALSVLQTIADRGTVSRPSQNRCVPETQPWFKLLSDNFLFPTCLDKGAVVDTVVQVRVVELSTRESETKQQHCETAHPWLKLG
jgi:hypothetical protein